MSFLAARAETPSMVQPLVKLAAPNSLAARKRQRYADELAENYTRHPFPPDTTRFFGLQTNIRGRVRSLARAGGIVLTQPQQTRVLVHRSMDFCTGLTIVDVPAERSSIPLSDELLVEAAAFAVYRTVNDSEVVDLNTIDDACRTLQLGGAQLIAVAGY